MDSTLRARLMLLYGLYAVVVGACYFVKGGLMVFGYPEWTGPGEHNLIGHLTQAHAGSLVGLGCVALILRHVRGDLRAFYAALLLANVLLAAVELLSAPTDQRGTSLFVVVALHGVFALGFARLWMLPASEPQQAQTRLRRQTALSRILFISFAVLVMASGLVWLLAPMKFATAASALAGAATVYIGQTRGAADVSLGMIAWAAFASGRPDITRAAAISLCVANLLLVIAGLLAQWSVLATPARWAVEGLHVLWMAGFAWLSHRDAPRPASLAQAS